MKVVAPIVIAEDLQGKLWLTVYGSREAVTRQLEVWFATDEDYRAFDSTGRVLDLVVQEGTTERRLKVLKVRTADEVLVRPVAESRPDELRELLLRFVAQQSEFMDEQASTPELTDRCARISSYGM